MDTCMCISSMRATQLSVNIFVSQYYIHMSVCPTEWQETIGQIYHTRQNVCMQCVRPCYLQPVFPGQLRALAAS